MGRAAHIETTVIAGVGLGSGRVQLAVEVDTELSRRVARERAVGPDSGGDLAARDDDVPQFAAQPQAQLAAGEVQVKAAGRRKQPVVI